MNDDFRNRFDNTPESKNPDKLPGTFRVNYWHVLLTFLIAWLLWEFFLAPGLKHWTGAQSKRR